MNCFASLDNSAVDSGGAGGARAPPEFGVQKRGKAWFLFIGTDSS